MAPDDVRLTPTLYKRGSKKAGGNGRVVRSKHPKGPNTQKVQTKKSIAKVK